MPLHAFQADADTARWSPSSWEARLLAGSLRGVAVTVLHGSDTSNRDELLRSGILPLLGRRLEDQAEPGGTGRVLPFPDRRGTGPSRRGAFTELVLLIDEWPIEPPLPTLAERIRAAARPDGDGICRVLLVLQGFETALAMAANASAPDPFWQELSEAVGNGATDMHLLIVTENAETPALRWLARGLSGLGDHALQLGNSPSLSAPHLVAIPGLAHHEPAAPPSDQDWLKDIDAALQRVVAQARHVEAPGGVEIALPPPEPEHEPEPVEPIPTAAAAVPVASTRRHFVIPALAGAAVIGLLLAVGSMRPRETPVIEAATPPAATPAPQPPKAAAPPAPRLEAGRAVLQALAPLSALDLRSGPAQLGVKGPPVLALVRYDALQDLPSTTGLRIVAPLFVEPVQVWVRADSPLRALNDLKQARIDTGLDGGDAFSATGVQRALFGDKATFPKQQHLADGEAVPALRRGEVDALLRTRASPVTAAAQAAGPSLRLLALDSADAASTRALREYLPVTLAQGQRTLGVMSFLVVRGGDSAAGDRLAGEAMRALCAASLPGMRPDIALPAGRPYAPATEQAAAQCRATLASKPPNQGDSR